MALRQPKPDPADPRLSGHETTYSSSRGGWVQPQPQPELTQDKDASGGRRWGKR